MRRICSFIPMAALTGKPPHGGKVNVHLPGTVQRSAGDAWAGYPLTLRVVPESGRTRSATPPSA